MFQHLPYHHQEGSIWKRLWLSNFNDDLKVLDVDYIIIILQQAVLQTKQTEIIRSFW